MHHTDTEGVKDILFIDAVVAHRTSDGSLLVFSRKALHEKSDMTVQAYVFGKQIRTFRLNPSIATLPELDTVLSVIDNTSVLRRTEFKEFSSCLS